MSDPTQRPKGKQRPGTPGAKPSFVQQLGPRDYAGLVLSAGATFVAVSVAYGLSTGLEPVANNLTTSLAYALIHAFGAWPTLLSAAVAMAVGTGLFVTPRPVVARPLALALVACVPATAITWAGLGGSGGAFAGVLVGPEAGWTARLASLALGAILLAAATYAFAAALGRAAAWKQVLAARIGTAGSRRRKPDEGRTGRHQGDRAEDTPGVRATHGSSTEQVPGADATGVRTIGAAGPSGRQRADAHLAPDAATAGRGAEPRPLGGAARVESDSAAALSDPAPVPRALEQEGSATHRTRPFGGVVKTGTEERGSSETELFAAEEEPAPTGGVRPFAASAGAAVAEPAAEELEDELGEDLEDEAEEEFDAAGDEGDLEDDVEEELEAGEDEELDAEEDEELESEEDEELDAEEDEDLDAEEEDDLDAEDDQDLETEDADEDVEAETEVEEPAAATEEVEEAEAEVETPAAAEAPEPVEAAETDDQPGLFGEDGLGEAAAPAVAEPAPKPASKRRSRAKPPKQADPLAEAVDPEPAVVVDPEPEVVVDPAPRKRTRNERRKAARLAAQQAAAPPDVDPEALVYEAGNLFLEEGRVAVSMLQKRWGLDFDQSTAILDRLQELGLIGPYLGGKPRQILLGADEWRSTAAEQA